ncbi:MAG: hypothetical protein AAFV90_21320 [Cyanobacteria bacterium J06634_5]
MQRHQDAQAVGPLGAQTESKTESTASSSPSQIYLSKPSVSTDDVVDSEIVDSRTAVSKTAASEASADRQHWLRATTFTGAAAVASAGIVMPLAGDGAIAANTYDDAANEAVVPQVQAASVRSFEAVGERQVVLPQVAQRNGAVFSTGYTALSEQYIAQAAAERGNRSLAADRSFAADRVATDKEATARAATVPLIAKGADGNWSLAYQAQNAQDTQALIAQLAEKTQQVPAQQASVQQTSAQQTSLTSSAAPSANLSAGSSAVTAQAVPVSTVSTTATPTATPAKATLPPMPCTGTECRGLDYIEKQLPIAQAKVQAAQKVLTDFETEHGQQDMAAYQKVLNDRIAEIAGQSVTLEASIDETRRVITQLKMRLVTVNADLGFAEQVLAQDSAYQTVWERLKQSEQKVIDEFSQANIDATALNETYADYQYHQQWLQRTVQEALGNYLTAPNVDTPDFVYQAPAALNTMQDLVIATHEYQVQQLRKDTIAEINKRLKARKAELVGNVGEYETLQRALSEAKTLVLQYEQGRDRITDPLATPSTLAPSAVETGQAGTAGNELNGETSALSRARALSLELPDGTLAKSLLGVVVAAGAIATATAVTRRKRAAKRADALTLSIAPWTEGGWTKGEWTNQPWAEASGSSTPQSIGGLAPVARQLLTPVTYPSLKPVMPMGGNTVEDELLKELLQITGGPVASKAAVESPTSPLISPLVPDETTSTVLPSAEAAETEVEIDTDIEFDAEVVTVETTFAAAADGAGSEDSPSDIIDVIPQDVEPATAADPILTAVIASAAGIPVDDMSVEYEADRGADHGIEIGREQPVDIPMTARQEGPLDLSGTPFNSPYQTGYQADDEAANQPVYMVETTAVPTSEDSFEPLVLEDEATQAPGADDDDALIVALMTRELNTIVNRAPADAGFAVELNQRAMSPAIEPVRLSLDDIDRFAEHAIEWVLKDLAYAPVASTAEPATAPVDPVAMQTEYERDIKLTLSGLEDNEDFGDLDADRFDESNPELDALVMDELVIEECLQTAA